MEPQIHFEQDLAADETPEVVPFKNRYANTYTAFLNYSTLKMDHTHTHTHTHDQNDNEREVHDEHSWDVSRTITNSFVHDVMLK